MTIHDHIRILFDGEEMQLLHLPGRSDFSLVTFDIMHARANGRSGFAMKLALKRGLDLYAIVPRRPNWYPEAEAQVCAARVRASKDRPSLGYGASMGGYGILRYGSALGLNAALAMSPQATIDPREIGERDPRYLRFFDPISHDKMRVCAGDLPPISYAACDPHFVYDVAQRNLLDERVIPIDLPHMGHHTSHAMTPSDNALARLQEALQGRTHDLQKALLSAARGTLQFAIGQIRKDLAGGDAEMAYLRSKAAHRRFGEDETLTALLGRSCLATGRNEEGIAAMSPLVAKRPDQIIYRRTLADLHEAAGDIAASIRHLAHAVTVSGNAVLTRKLRLLRDNSLGDNNMAMAESA